MGWYGREYLYRHLVDEFWEIKEEYMWLREYTRAFHHNSYNLERLEEEATKIGNVVPSSALGKYAIGNFCRTCGKFWNEWRKKNEECPQCKSTYIVKSIFSDTQNYLKSATKIPKPRQKYMDWAKEIVPKNCVGIFARGRKTYGRNLKPEFYVELIQMLESMGHSVIWLGEKQSTQPCPVDHVVDFSRMDESRELERTLAIVSHLDFTVQFWTASSRLAGMMGVPFLLFESPEQIYCTGLNPAQEGKRLELTSFGPKKVVLAHYLNVLREPDAGLALAKRAIDEMKEDNYEEIIGMVDDPKEKHPDKYIILCSWPGFEGLFPYVDEYWSHTDESSIKTLALAANNGYNGSDLSSEITRGLNEVFSDVLNYQRDFRPYYDNGFTKKYWEDFGEVNRYLPEVSSSTMISSQFTEELERRKGRKVVVYPASKVRTWHRGKSMYLPVNPTFWKALIERLLNEGYVPVVYQNQFTHDMSPEFTDRCVYLVSRNVSDVLAAMRHVGCVLDVHSGVSRFAVLSRTPFVCIDERARFIGEREYEIDDLSCDQIAKKYLFSFSTLLMAGTEKDWNRSVIDNIVVSLKEIWPFVEDRSNWAPTTESYESVDYSKVRDRQSKRLGVRFISSSKEK
ncbi:unnamed protein product [Symbiodinium microadriaticum]|nr:unnamed protein product [Symbiodinium microadriaticum]